MVFYSRRARWRKMEVWLEERKKIPKQEINRDLVKSPAGAGFFKGETHLVLQVEWTAKMAGGGKAEPLFQIQSNAWRFFFRRDGVWLRYIVNSLKKKRKRKRNISHYQIFRLWISGTGPVMTALTQTTG